MPGRSARRNWRAWRESWPRRNVRRVESRAETQWINGQSWQEGKRIARVRQGGAVMERAMLEYLANALWQLPVLAGGTWALLSLMKAGPRTQYRVWLGVLGITVLLPAW